MGFFDFFRHKAKDLTANAGQVVDSVTNAIPGDVDNQVVDAVSSAVSSVTGLLQTLSRQVPRLLRMRQTRLLMQQQI